MPILDAAHLVGRSAELSRLEVLISGLGRRGAPAVVDVSGDAGIGKSRLLGEVCARARQAGLTVLRGRATEYEQHTPFHTFADALADADPAQLNTEPALAEAEAALRGLLRPENCVPGAGGLQRFAIHRAITACLGQLARQGLVIALDDLHWADPESLELVDHLIRHPVPSGVLLVLARRKRQTPTSLAAALARGTDAGAVLGMVLEALPERESIAALAPDLPADHAVEIYAASEGNPLYLLALLQAYRRGAPLADLTARAHVSDASGVPSELTSLLLDELTALSEPQRRVAEAVAVLGDDATYHMLGLSTGYAAAEVDRCTDALARRDLLRSRSGGRWALRHPLLRALVYENTAAGLRAEIHRRAAAALARNEAGPAERAHHIERSLTGWDPVAAAVLSEAAGQLANSAPATSAHLLDVVLRFMPETPGHAYRRGELMLSRARALGVSGDLRSSRHLLHQVIGTLGEEHPSLRAEAVAQCAVMERHLGHSPEADALLRRELASQPGPAPGQATPLGLALGMSALLTRSYPEVRSELARTLATARSLGDLTGEAGALALTALGEAYEGRMDAAGCAADAAAGLADGLTDPKLTDLCEALVWLAWGEALLERYEDAERHADRGLDIARRSGQLYVLPNLLVCSAYVHLLRCRLPVALEAADEAESIARAIGSGELLAFTLAFKTLVLIFACPLGDVRPLLSGEEAVSATGRRSGWWESLAWCMLGHAARASGDPHRAMEAVLHAGGGSDLRGIQPSIRPAQLETLVNAAVATGRLERAERWVAQAVEEAERLGLRGQRAAALQARATIAEHRGDQSAAASLCDEAVRMHAQSGAALCEAYALLRAIPLAKGAGHDARAAAMWHRAHRIATAGGAHLILDLAEMLRPGVVDDRPRLPPELAALTTREHEIAEMVAEGLSNQSIATKLHLSHRTVETHLSTIYRKTSLPSRAALAAFMTRSTIGGLV